MITAASLKSYTSKELGQLAKEEGVNGWHSMRKAELVQALSRVARRKTAARTKAAATRKSKPAKSTTAKATASTRTSVKSSRSRNGKTTTATKTTKPSALKKIREAHANRGRRKDLTSSKSNGDRLVLMVRDSYWLHACWEISARSVQRAQAAMAEHWHCAVPTLRLLQVEAGTTTSTSEKVVRDITVHGEVKNWFLDIPEPGCNYRVEIGYLTTDERFFAIARSNTVAPPEPGTSSQDDSWADGSENYDRIFALSGGQAADDSELRQMFEERLRRPMGSPAATRFGVGAERVLNRNRQFQFDVDAEMIIFGSAKPGSYVTLSGEPVKLRDDGTFSVRMSLPDRRQVIPVVAASGDGVEQHTTVLAIERNTKKMEPLISDQD